MPSWNLALPFASTAVAVVIVASCGGESTRRDAGDAAAAADAAEEIGDSPDAPLPADGSQIPLSHRPSATGCPARAPGTPCSSPTAADGGATVCTSDADCTSGINGRCDCPPFVGFADAGLTSACVYDLCESDDDCPGAVCSCGGYAPAMHVAALVGGYVCVTGNCRTDGDCGKGGYCSPSLSACSYITEFACHTPMDECVNDSDCAPLSSPRVAACTYSDSAGHWVCSSIQPCDDGGI
jgi:hypothetical protein